MTNVFVIILITVLSLIVGFFVGFFGLMILIDYADFTLVTDSEYEEYQRLLESYYQIQ